jgi:hypothetical protein
VSAWLAWAGDDRTEPIVTGVTVRLSRRACQTRTGLEPFHFAKPAFAFGLGDAVEQVGADLLEAVPLGGVGPQERAPDTCLTEMILGWDASFPGCPT